MCYDVVIIGAGPAGLTAGIYARSKGMTTLILDCGRIGGQLVSLYPEKGIKNYPGYETIQARKLADKLYAQAETTGCVINEFEKAEKVDNGNEEFIIKTNKAEYRAKSVIVAIGMGSFKPKKMGVPGEEELADRGVVYLMPPKESIVGKKITVFGGGNSAIDMSLVANTITETTLVHRKPEFRADESTVEELKESDVKTIMDAALVSINGTDKVESVTLKDNATGAETVVPTDYAVINIGISADLSDLVNWGLELTSGGLVKVNYDMTTNRPGVFSCGDVIDYEGKYKQIITACGEGATAAMSAYKFVKKPYWA